MGELLRDLIAGRGWDRRLALGRLRESWGQIVGEHVAARSEPVRLAEGTLLVQAESGVWATELALLAPSLSAKVDAFLGGGIVREVRVIAGGRTSISSE